MIADWVPAVALVDSAKWIRERLLYHVCPQRVVFHHVPKCGGTSVGRTLRRRYILSQATVLPNESLQAFASFTGGNDREQMLVDVLDLREQMFLYLLHSDVRCISLHVRFSEVAHRLFADRYKFVTILREPVSRFISNYFWSFAKPRALPENEIALGPFLETDRARRLGASYVQYFCGLPKDSDFTEAASIEAAKTNLAKFDVVGHIGDRIRFERDIRNALGVRLRIGHENRARQSASERDQVVTPELRAEIEALCAPDIAVWRHACATNSFQNVGEP